MDITLLRVAATLASFAMFIGIVAWAFSRRHGQRFDEAANLPFQQD
jgi:cytochrome c oxidase cbb3-type subunit 4